jgi:hypothetical protein
VSSGALNGQRSRALNCQGTRARSCSPFGGAARLLASCPLLRSDLLRLRSSIVTRGTP